MKINFQKLFARELSQNPFCLIDIGARGGIRAEWRQLLPHIRMIAFEPDAAEHARLSQQKHEGEFICHPTALYSTKSEIPFHLTRIEGLSSVRPPNRDFLDRFSEQNIAGYEIKKILKMEAMPLDGVLSTKQISELDFLKIDVEGCAWEVMAGAQKVLKESVILGARIESEFNPKYEKQHLFSETCTLMIQNGFELTAIKPCYWKHKNGLKTGGSEGNLGSR